MAWPGKKEEELPAALQGKSPEEIAKIVGEAAKLAETVETQKSALQTLNTQFENLKARQIELERSSQTNNATQNNNKEHKEKTKWSEDADTAFQERIDEVLSPLRNGIMATSAQTARMAAERHIMSNPFKSKLLNKYSAEVEDAIKKTLPQYLTIPQTYVSIFEMVIGRHIEELVVGAQKKEGDLFAESNSDSNGGMGGGGKPAEAVLTDADRAYAKKAGISEEAMLKSKQRLGMTA